MKNDKIDLRISRTHKLLWEAMVKLTVEKGYGNISVSDICSYAMINRSTFYRHFEDKNDLLLRKTDETLFEMVKKAKKPQDIINDGDYSEYNAFLDFIAEYKDFFKIMFGTGGMQIFTERIYNYLLDVTEKRLQELPLNLDNPPMPLKLVIHYIAGAHLSLLKWWVENDLPCSAEDLVQYNLQLFTNDPLTLLGMSDEILNMIRKV